MLLLWLATILACRAPAAPGLLVLVTDTTRADLGGAASATLDRLGETGRRYSQARSAATWTAPSTATLLTGVWPPEHGVRGNFGQPFVDSLLAPTWLEPAGATVITDHHGLAGAMGRWGLSEPLLVERSPGSALAADTARAWLADQDQPWVLYLHLLGPHDPWPGAPEAWTATYRSRIRGGPMLPEIASWAGASYAQAMEQTDHALAALLAELPDGSTVLWTADHGEALGEDGMWNHGGSLHLAQSHVPLVLWGEGVEPGLDERLVPATCVAATVLAATVGYGLPRAPDCDLRTGELPPDLPARTGSLLGDFHVEQGRRWISVDW